MERPYTSCKTLDVLGQVCDEALRLEPTLVAEAARVVSIKGREQVWAGVVSIGVVSVKGREQVWAGVVSIGVVSVKGREQVCVHVL